VSAVLQAAALAGCSSLPASLGDFVKSRLAAEDSAAKQKAEEPAEQTAAEPVPSPEVDAAPPTAATTAAGAPAAALPAAVMQVAPAAPAPPPAEQPQRRRLQDQLINTKAKVETAADAFAEIKRQSQTQGFSPSPDITRAMRRAEMSLEAAKDSIEKGEISEATESLKIAEASANQVLRAAGSL
jgi:hypothetical protein